MDAMEEEEEKMKILENLTIFLMFISIAFFLICTFGCLFSVGICLKIYTEMMKEHTIRKRYETQIEGRKSS